MKVLVFQHIAIEHPGIFRDFLKQDGIARDTVELDAGAAIPELEDYAALIVMGGPMDVWQEREHPWLAAEKRAIRRAVMDLRLPFLGFCLGHQLMAAALGGKVGKMPRPEVGVLDVELTPAGRASTLLAGLPATIKSLQWHGAEVAEAPPDSVILARSPLCGIQALQYGESAFGLQFHIEMIASTVADWGDIPAYKQALEQTLGPGALQGLKAETDKWMNDFNHSARVIYDNFIAIVKKRVARNPLRPVREKMTAPGTHRLWKPIALTDNWRQCDTSRLDELAPSWFERREVLQKNSGEYQTFIAELKREHAIETGIVERLYDLDKGVTETFIKKGFAESYISHNDTNVPVPRLMAHLSDHLNAVDFVFDMVKKNRALTISFVKELHALVTQNQEFSEGRDQFGKKVSIKLTKGAFKTLENNPVRADGVKILYCPVEHVASEMDNLVAIYNKAESDKVSPLICAAWFHHAFTMIHPFQDGNGRVARLLASLILIKHRLFPFTVPREEAKSRYIDALEKADADQPQTLVEYFAEVQKRSIEKALSLREGSGASFDEVAEFFSGKIEKWQERQTVQREEQLDTSRMRVFDFCLNNLKSMADQLRSRLNGNTILSIQSCPPNDQEKQGYYYGQIIKYAKKHNYYFNRNFPKGWLTLPIELADDKRYQLCITVHHYGYDDSTLAIGAFLEFLTAHGHDRIDEALPLEIKPHIISITDDVTPKEKNIKGFIQDALTLSMAQIASEL